MAKCCPSCSQNIKTDWGRGLGLPLEGLRGACAGTGQLKLSLMPLLTEWTQRDLERMENIRFCRQYLVFHDGDSVVFSGPAGNSVETRGE